MKSYTDIKQSKNLAKILPLESADMRYGCIAPYEYSDIKYDGGCDEVPYPKDFMKKNVNFSENEYDGELPCYSLTALLSVLPNDTNIIKAETDTENEKYMCTVGIKNDIISTFADNPVDACVEMILKLHEKSALVVKIKKLREK